MITVGLAAQAGCGMPGDTSSSEAPLRRIEMTLAELPGSSTKIWVFPAEQMSPEGMADLAGRACGHATTCKVAGWTDQADAPTIYPWPEQARRSLAFSYERDRDRAVEVSLWDCTRFPQDDPSDCLAK